VSPGRSGVSLCVVELLLVVVDADDVVVSGCRRFRCLVVVDGVAAGAALVVVVALAAAELVVAGSAPEGVRIPRLTNLWPEPYAGRWGARTKDVLEDRPHDRVCSGQLSLTFAQHIEATNLVAAYRGTPAGRRPRRVGPVGAGDLVRRRLRRRRW
jgi:hypothetical protein